MNRFRRHCLLGLPTLALLALMFARDARAARPDALLRLVGDDAGLCIELPNLERHVGELERSEFFARLRQTGLYQKWLAGDDFRKLQRTRKAVEEFAEQSLAQFGRDVFGEAVVVALYARPNHEPVGVLLTQTVSEEVLHAVVNAWNRAEPQKTLSLRHAGREYFRRTRLPQGKSPSETLFYVCLGRTLALSDQEATIRQVIELDAAEVNPATASGAAGGGSLLESPRYLAARQGLAMETVAAAYVNPRAWDAAVAQGSQKTEASEVLRRCWKSCESIAIGVRIDGGLAAEAVVRFGEQTPPGWDRLVEAMGPRPSFLDRVPADSLIVVAGRCDLRGAGSQLERRIPAHERRDWQRARQVLKGLLLGNDLFDEVLPALGPNWVAYGVARKESGERSLPIDAVLAVELPTRAPNNEAGGPSGLRAAVENALRTGLNVLAAARNTETPDTPAAVRFEETAVGTLRWIESYFGYEPAYGLMGDALILATAPALVREIGSRKPAESLGGSPQFAAWSQRYFSGAGPLLFADLNGLRDLVVSRRENLIGQATQLDGLSAEEAGRRVAAFQDALGLFDAAFLTVELHPDQFRIIAGGLHKAAPPRR